MACGRGTGTQLCRVHQHSSWRGPLQLWAHCRYSHLLHGLRPAILHDLQGLLQRFVFEPSTCLITVCLSAAQHGVSPNTKQIWWVAAAQGITFFVSDVIGISVELKYHQFDYAKFIPRKPTRILFFLMVTQLVGSTR